MSKKHIITRRNFIKGVGLAATVPWLPAEILADPKKNNLVESSPTHKILCCNIRVALPRDDESGNGWNDRKDLCKEVIDSHNPDIICLQEVLEVQNEDLKKAFPNFFSFGFEGPEMDAHDEGYHGVAKNPIFFNTNRYELISAGTYWLSETPHIGGSKSWGTARARHVNWVRIRDKKSDVEFRVLSLHLDHVSQEAREKQISMVMDETNQYPDDFRQILTGDFNASAANDVVKAIKSNGWTDTYTAIHGEGEPGATVHVFKGENDPKKDRRKKIDFIFSRGGNIKSHSAGIIKDHRNGRYPSDHYFIDAEVEL
jgi:endonuclease/exonuclease/phosphatase family metal-dependent hydrolase